MAGNHVLLETISLTQSAASVTFDNIPQSGYTDLKIVVSARTDLAGAQDNGLITFNGSSSDFSYTRLYGDGSGGVGANTSSGNNINIIYPGSTATANTFNNSELYIPNYTSSSNKSWTVDSVQENNTTEAYAFLIAGLWSNTAAITSVGLAPRTGPNFVAGSTFSLYGVADVNTTPVTAPLATGGNIVANDGTYWYHAFTTSGTFTPQTSLTCDTVVVAGGGGGGNRVGGGGGAGGYRLLTGQSVTSIPHTIAVGAGGAGGIYSTPNSTSGTNSISILSLTASGGGRGGDGPTSQQGTTGGSGGAPNGNITLTGNAGNAGGYSPVEGYASGNSIFVPGSGAGGGGGGAGATGSNGTSGQGGNGGAGTNAVSSWLSATGLGVSGFIAGGGGGGTESGYTPGAAGSGGGGTGSSSAVPATSAVVNTGSGGGGGGCCSVNQNGGNGGSGIVIIRYAMV